MSPTSLTPVSNTPLSFCRLASLTPCVSHPVWPDSSHSLRFASISTFPHPQFDEQEFVKKAPWAHLDIAGPVWDDKKGGATGFAVRTLVRFVEGKAK